MPRPISVTAGNHAAPKSQRGLERYPTPPCATVALLHVEPLPNGIWDPCGRDDDAVAVVLREHGLYVVTNDIAADRVDFLQRRTVPSGIRAITTNPPFSLAADFVWHGLTLVPKVVILQRIQFLESEARAELFDSGTLVRDLSQPSPTNASRRLDRRARRRGDDARVVHVRSQPRWISADAQLDSM